MENGARLVFRGFVGAAVLVAAAVGGYLLYGGVKPGPQPATVTPTAELTAEGNDRVGRIANEIVHQDHLADEDGRYLRQTVEVSDEIVVQRWALAAMADHLGKESKMSSETRRLLEETIISALASDNQRMAICAIGCSEQSRLIERDDVQQKIRALRAHPNSDIAARASRSPLPGEG